MLTEIKNLHTKINKDQMVRIVTSRQNFEIMIDKTDLIKTTKSGMLRIIRANGNITSINPEFIVMTCIVKRSALL